MRKVVTVGTNAEDENVTSLVLVPEANRNTQFRLLKAGQRDFLRAVYAEHKQHAFKRPDALKVAKALGNSRATCDRHLADLTDKGMINKAVGGFVVNSDVAMILAGMSA